MNAVERFVLLGTAFCIIAASACPTPAAQGPETARTEAKRILDAAGPAGGLIVHIECGDGKLTAALRSADNILVHGLDTSAKNIATAREHIRSLGLYGSISVERLTSARLPYADNMVNLVVSENPGRITSDEIMRVLAPRGAAYVKTGDKWTKTVKPRPKNIDEWTHYLHGPSNNAVAKDSVVGPPKRVQWICGPQWARSHDHLSTTSAMVSAAGRVFYIIDEGSTAFAAMKPKWKLIARDAFNGVLLWKRNVGPWEGHLRGFRTGPAELARRLVAIGDRVYVTLGYGKPICALDAATGETQTTYESTAGAMEFICHNGVLYTVVGDRAPDNINGAAVPVEPKDIWHWWAIYKETPPKKRLLAVNADTGKLLWKKDDAETVEILPTALAAKGSRAFIQNPTHIIALNAETGKVLWRAPRASARQRPSWTAPTLVAYGDVVLSADRAVGKASPADNSKRKVKWTVSSLGGVAPVGKLLAFSADAGKKLWESPAKEVYNAPVDVLVAGGLIWTGNMVQRSEPGITAGRDPNTGQVKRTRPKDSSQFAYGPVHHRCYRNKATEKYLVLGRDGIEFIDIATGKGQSNQWTRGACQYGVMPCNGLVYIPPHACACHIEYKLSNFNVLAPADAKAPQAKPSAVPRLEKGPAFDKIPQSKIRSRQSHSDWSTHRADANRSGSTTSAVPPNLTGLWETKIGGKLSGITIAAGRVFATAIDEHTVHCLDAVGGRGLWRFVAGGRIDSPPTIWNGRVIFGCADGWIYCLHETDGKLAWRFRTDDAERRIISYGQLEAARPVSGAVMVAKGAVYAIAGRSTFLDGGLTLYRLDAVTGKLISATPVDTGALPDVLSSDGESVFMRHKRFDMDGNIVKTPAAHLYSSAGFLDGEWWHRTYWQVGSRMSSTWGGWPVTGNRVPSGRLLVLDKSNVYGFGRLNQYHRDGSHVGMGKTKYQLFACDRVRKPAKAPAKRRRAPSKVTVHWSRDVGVIVRAMVLTGDSTDKTLFVAGPPDIVGAEAPRGKHPYTLRSPKTLQEQEAAFQGKRQGAIWAISTVDGKTLNKIALPAPPVWDGMAASRGRLYLATMDGKVSCYGKK
ncbi:MAG: PQQ-binding-like beta-propeller repeat protein [Phycisphaerae bacterium]|jgi:outer membrane protein assembly factor BamB|nr:PQQ-binding-like beta-propeller repeat protein [Phycisphaerae bacterium]